MGNVHATFLHLYNDSSNYLSVQNPILLSKVLRDLPDLRDQKIIEKGHAKVKNFPLLLHMRYQPSEHGEKWTYNPMKMSDNKNK